MAGEWIVRWRIVNTQIDSGVLWIVHFGWNEAVDPEFLLLPATKVPVAALLLLLLLLLLSVKPATRRGHARRTHPVHTHAR